MCDSVETLQVCQLILVQPVQCDLMLVYQHCRVLRDVRTIALQIRHRVLSWAFSSNGQGATSHCYAVVRCTMLASLLFSSRPFIVPRVQLFHHSQGFTQFCTGLDVHNQLRQLSFAHPAPARFNRSPIILWWSVGASVRRTPILQVCSVVVVQKPRLTSFQHLHNFFAVETADVSVLYSFLYSKIECMTVFRSGSCSQPIRERICCRTVTLHFNFHLNSQIHEYRSHGYSKLTSFHHCVELPLLRRSALSSSEVWIRISPE